MQRLRQDRDVIISSNILYRRYYIIDESIHGVSDILQPMSSNSEEKND